MIELIPTENDDLAFLCLVQRIVNGAIAALQVCEVYLVHIDNCFDHKWLRWHYRSGQELRVLPFDPNRVRSEKHFVWDADHSRWMAVDQRKPLHVRRPGRSSLDQPIDRFSRSAAFIWYSGNTVTNQAGSLMFYLSGAEGYAWYASLTKKEHWTVGDECQITRRELKAFEQWTGAREGRIQR